MSDRVTYWRHLAEEHGDCLCEFMAEPAITPQLCYEQAVVAAHFARLVIEAEADDLEAPEPGTVCPDCGEVADGVKGFCASCHEGHKPITFDAFLSLAVSDCVNGGRR